MHDIKFLVSSIKGDSRVDFKTEGSLLFCRHFVVNEQEIHTDSEIRLSVDGSTGFVVLEIDDPSQEIREHFEPDVYLEGTNDEILLLPVRSVSFLEAPVFV